MSKRKKGAEQPALNHRLRRWVAINAVICAIIWAVFIGGAYIFSTMTNAQKTKADETETEVLQLTAKLGTLQTQMMQVEEALPVAQKILDKGNDSELNLSRDFATSVFIDLKAQYPASEMKVGIGPVAELTEPQFKKEAVQAVRATITIDMVAFSDEQVLVFIEDVLKRLPGLVSVYSIEMKRGSTYSLDDTEQQPTESLREPQTETRIIFYWYGLRLLEKTAQGAAS